MKRILSLALICVILVVSLAPQASAAESDFSGFYEVLDISLPGDGTNTKVNAKADGVYGIFNVQQAWDVDYVDVLFSVPDGSNITYVKVGANSVIGQAVDLHLVQISSTLYRAYGEFKKATRTFYFHVGGKPSYVDWNSVRVSTSSLSGYDENGQAIVMAYGYSDTINYVPTDTINHRSFSGTNNPEYNQFNAYITPDNWQKYDYMDIIFQADLASIDSINAQLGDTIIPFRISYLSPGDVLASHYEVAVRLDLRDLDRTSSEWFYVHVEGEVVTASNENLFGILGMRGFVQGAKIDKDVAWYRKLYTFLVNDFYFNIRSILEACYGLLYRMDSYLDPSTSSGDEFKNESSDLISGLDDISSSMNSIDRPSMDSINADFSGDISDASVLMAGLFSQVTQIPWLATIILASCTLGLISYILYGKD